MNDDTHMLKDIGSSIDRARTSSVSLAGPLRIVSKLQTDKLISLELDSIIIGIAYYNLFYKKTKL